MSHQTCLIFRFIDFEEVFSSADRIAKAKVLDLYSIPHEYIKAICATYRHNTAAVKVESEAGIWFCFISGV